jgi:hypothetical protein
VPPCRWSSHADSQQNALRPPKHHQETNSTSEYASTSDVNTPRSPHHRNPEAPRSASRRKALQYAEQNGWLTSHAEELTAALEFQTSWAAALGSELEAARAQLAARIAEDERSAVALAEEHAAALAVAEGEAEDARAARARAAARVTDLETRCGNKLCISCFVCGARNVTCGRSSRLGSRRMS